MLQQSVVLSRTICYTNVMYSNLHLINITMKIWYVILDVAEMFMHPLDMEGDCDEFDCSIRKLF